MPKSLKDQNNFISCSDYSISCLDKLISCFAKEPYYHNISGQKWPFDKIPKPKIIYWELPISLKGQNNSISCLDYSISCLDKLISCFAKELYYCNISGQKWAFDKIPKPKIIYWELPIPLKGQNNSISCLDDSISCLDKLISCFA